MGFIPPLNLGNFQPSPATLSQWIYQIWQYLQDNPIATQEQLEEYIATFITTSPETQALIGEGVEQYLTENPPQAPVQSVQGKTGTVTLAYNDIVSSSNTIPVYKASSTPSTSTLVGQYNLGYRLFVNTATQEIFTISPAGALSLVGRGKFDGTTVDLNTTQGDTTIAEAIAENADNIETLDGNIQAQADSIASNTQNIANIQRINTFTLSSTATTLLAYSAIYINHIVLVNVRFKGTGGAVNVGTIPSSYRPSEQQNLYCVSHTAQDSKALVVQPGGGIVTGAGTVNDAEYRALIVYAV